LCSACEERSCVGNPWSFGVPFTIVESGSSGSFDWTDIERIRNVISAWSAGISFVDCGNDCESTYPRWLQIDAASTSSIGPQVISGVQHLSLVPGQPSYRYAHDIGHALGMVDDVQRPDREIGGASASYEAGCAATPDRRYLWRCAPMPAFDPAAAPASTSALGVYPAPNTSIMTAAAHEGCSNDSHWPGPSQPTAYDIANVSELAVSAFWSPFMPITPEWPPRAAPSSQVGIASGVAACSRDYPDLMLFVRATDSAIYWSEKRLKSGVFAGWSDWQSLGGQFASDPTCTVDDAGVVQLAATDRDGVTWLRSGLASDWQALGQPLVGGGSAPALTSHVSEDGEILDVFIRGLDGHLHQKQRRLGTWSEWKPRAPNLLFNGKPSATRYKNSGVVVALRGSNATLNVLELHGEAELLHPLPAYFVGDPAIVAGDPDTPYVFMSGMDGRLWQWAGLVETSDGLYILGGRLAGSPAVSARASQIDIVVPMSTGESTSLWWKFSNYQPSCHFGDAECTACGE